MALKKAHAANVNEKLKQARLERNRSQEYIAGQIGTTSISVSRWERGITTPSPYYRKKLCGLYGKSEAELGIAKEVTPINIEELQQVSHEQVQQSQNLWNMPYKRSPFFTGREGVLQDLCKQFSTANSSVVMVAINGLGGIGKTLTAIEFAHRFRSSYRAVLWVNAETYNTLASDYVKIASKSLLDLPEKEEQNQALIVAAVKHRLSDYEEWLLVFDNVVDLSTIGDFIPQTGKGHVLVTTRDQVAGDDINYQIKLDKMEPEESILFLLRRARILSMDASPDMTSAPNLDAASAISKTLDHLPLALDQAGAYIEETQCSLTAYLNLYETQHTVLLKRPGRLAIRYRETVATTWSLSFHRVERANPVAADLLRFFAFLHAEGIPEEIVITCSRDLGPILEGIDNPLALDQAIEELLKYSLVHRHADNQTLGIHRLVQTVLKDGMSKNQQREWAERAVRAVNRIFPSIEFDTLQSCQRYLPQALTCAALIKQWNITSLEAAHLLQRVGNYLWDRFQYDQSEPLCQQALEIYEKMLGPEHPDTASALNNLGSLYFNQGKYNQAEPLYLRAQTICEKVLGSDHRDVATGLTNLAYLYERQGKYTEAESLCLRGLLIREKILGPEHPEVASSLTILAGIYLSQGKYAAVEPLYQRTLKICEKMLGLESPDMANSLNNLAVLYLTQGKYDAAEPLCLQALSISEKVWGPDHPYVAFCLSNLAMVYFKQGKHSAAEPLCQKALAIRESELGPEHRFVANNLSMLAAVYKMQEKYDQAEPLYQRAQGIYEKVLGLEHPDVATNLVNLAVVCTEQGKYNQAELLCQQALAIRMKVLTPEHPDMAHSLSNLAMIYTKLDKYTEAAPHYEQALAITEKTLGQNHPDTVKILENYADLLRKMGRENEAEELEARAHRMSST